MENGGALPERLITLADYTGHPRNYNRHPKQQLEKLRYSLRTFGQIRNIVVWRGYLIAGHGLAEAARAEGWDTLRANALPDDWPEEKAVAYLAADNVLAAQGDPDQVALAHLAQMVHAQDKSLFEAIGFGKKEADRLLTAIIKGAGQGDNQPSGQDEADLLLAKWGVKPGDLWLLDSGKGYQSRLICGDGTDPATARRLLHGLALGSVITDPPYGMDLDASFANSVDNLAKGAKKSRGYAQVEGDNKPYEPAPILDLYPAKERFFWGADYYIGRLPQGGSWLVWDKRATVEDVDYSSSEFELCYSLTPHHRTILRVPWFGIIGTEQQDTKKRLHPNQKPLGLYLPLVQKYGGAVVADPYAGSGSSLIACEQLGRAWVGTELTPAYTAVILERWANYTNREPMRA